MTLTNVIPTLLLYQLAATGVAITMFLTLRPAGPRLYIGFVLLLLLPCALLVAGTIPAAITQLAGYAAIATAKPHDHPKGAIA